MEKKKTENWTNAKSDSATDLRIFSYSETYGVAKAALHYSITIDMVKNARRRVREKRATIAKSFTSEEHEMFRKACYGAAYSVNLKHEAEDFASWAIIKRLEGRSATPKQFVLDYLREQYGNGKDHPKKQSRWATPIKEDTDPETEGVVVAAKDDAPTYGRLFAMADLLKLDLKKRVIFLLYYKDGYEASEIAHYIGVAKPSVFKQLDLIHEALMRNAEAKDLAVKD